MIGVGEDGDSALFVDGGHRFVQRQPGRDGLCYPQAQDVPNGAADLDAGHDVEWVFMLMFTGPQGGVHPIMVGNSDNIEMGVIGNVVQHFADGWHAVAGAGVDVQVGAAQFAGV